MRRRNVPNIRAGECLALCLFVGVVLTCRAAAQKPSAPPAPEHDPAVGVWKVNPDKSHPKLTAKDVQCQLGADRKDGPCTVAVSRDGNVRVSKIVAIGLMHVEVANSESRALCDGERHLLEQPAESDPGPVFRDPTEIGYVYDFWSGPPSRSYMLCWYVTPSLVGGELGIDLTDPHNTGLRNPFFFGTVIYWGEEVSPDRQEKTFTVYSDKKRTKIKRTIVSDRIK
jgi:hypothetical protein